MKTSVGAGLTILGLIVGILIGHFAIANISPVATVTSTVVTTVVGVSPNQAVDVSGTISTSQGYTGLTVTFTSTNYSDDRIASTAVVNNAGDYSISLPDGHSFEITLNKGGFCGYLYLNSPSKSFAYNISC